VSSFQPLPLLGNPHVQTILGSLLSGGRRASIARQHVIALPDGDRIVLHETPPRRPGAQETIALLVHGLGGCHRSGYMQRTTNRLCDLGWRVFRMDLRGAGAGLSLARRFYNAACSDDVRVVIEHLAEAWPGVPLAVVGFSLGGNIVVKLAAECAERPLPSLIAVAAMAPPLDLIRCSDLIAKYPLYDAFYVHHLTTQVAEHERHFPDLPKIVFPRRTTLRQFDELYTAPRWGYANALDYYGQASALPSVPKIRVPSFLLTARDDPFVAVESFDAIQAAPPVEVHIAERGGHLGFVGPDGSGGIRWAETQIVNWLQKQRETVASRRGD
jgi:uncharacterized protein